MIKGKSRQTAGFYKSIRNYLGVIAISIIAISYVYYMLNVRFWKRDPSTISWDTISYYAYLPAKFIYHDLSLKFIEKDPSFFNKNVWPEVTEENKYVIKTSMGLAYLYSPFFFAGHLYAKNSEYKANGYSMPYQVSMAFSGLFYALIGFFFLWKILRRYFPPGISFLVMLSIGLATNLYTYSTQSATMPHSFNFALITIFLWLTIQWYKKKKWITSLWLGLIFGLFVLIRPTNIVLIFVFFLYGVLTFDDIKNRFVTLFMRWPHILVILGAAFLVWIPQIFYWKMQTGQLLYFSYGSDERFFWLEPVFFKGLFSFRKGWLIYTPLMIYSLAGLFLMKKQEREFRFAFITVTLLAMYVTFSWWCWWYGGSFGMRPMIDYYGMLAIPLGSFLVYLENRKPGPKIILSVLFSISILLGVYHHIQYHYGTLHFDSMTWKAYRHNFGKIKPGEDKDIYLDPPDYDSAKLER